MSNSDVHPTLQTFHKTLRGATGSVLAVLGVFREKSKTQQVVRAVGSCIEIWTFHKTTASFTRLFSQETFSHIQEIGVLRPLDAPMDQLVIVSDSGNLTLASLDMNQMKFIPSSNEPFYKSGIRRMAQGNYLAIDGRNRAICLGAIEQNKLVFTINRVDSKLSVSSPLEANRPYIITYSLIGVDVGYDNPLFAALEVDYSTKDSQKIKMLNYYELDMGLNHVIRSGSYEVVFSAGHLIPVPGGEFGPSGVLVCSLGKIEYRTNFNKDTISITLPRRKDGPISEIVCSVVHQMKKSFFILAQTQLGDILRITLDYRGTQESSFSFMSDPNEAGLVNDIIIRYFDSISVCSQLLIFKSGFMYANSEMGDQYIYQFEKLGDDPGEKEWTSNEPSNDIEFETKSFDNLNLVNIINSLNPLMGLEIDSNSKDITKVTKLITLTGSQSRSSMKLISDELTLEPIVNQDLPSTPRNIWTVKMNSESKFDDFIVISFDTSTIALKIGDDVEEAEPEDTGLDSEISSILVTNIGESIVQIHSLGFRQITFNDGNFNKAINWDVPNGLEILKSSSTSNQLVLALSNGELVYFEINNDGSGSLNEFTRRKNYLFQITSLSFSEIPKGSILSPFIIIGTKDQKLEILSTLPKKTFEVLSSNDMVNVVSDVCVTNDFEVVSNEEGEVSKSDKSKFHLHVGFQNGLYTRYQLSEIGELVKPQNKYIGPEKIKLTKIEIDNLNYVGVHNIRTWICYPGDKLSLKPMPKPEKIIEEEEEEEDDDEAIIEKQDFSDGFTSICNLNSEDIESGILLIHDSKLIIASKPDMNKGDRIESIPLRYTPRDVCSKEGGQGMVYVACSDKVKSPFTKLSNEEVEDGQYFYPTGGVLGEIIEDENENSIDKVFEKAQQVGYDQSVEWSSCIHVISLKDQGIGQTIELLENESAQKITIIPMTRDNETNDYIFVSTIKDFNVLPKKYGKCFIRIYKVLDDESLEFMYKHEMPRPVLSMTNFQGLALFGWGNELGLFELGKKQLIRKAGHQFPPPVREIVGLETEGNRIVVSDIGDSIRVLVFIPKIKKFVEFADDIISKHVTKSLMLDYDTIMIGDKFGTISIMKVPNDISEISDSDQDGSILKLQESRFNGSSERLTPMMSFYVGEVITGMKKCKLGLSNEEVVIYAGMNGSIGLICPLKTLREVNFFTDLQKFTLDSSSKMGWLLTNRDHSKFRSYYSPIKGCIDGDLIEMYTRLPLKAQEEISKLMEIPIDAILSRITDLSSRVGFP